MIASLHDHNNHITIPVFMMMLLKQRQKNASDGRGAFDEEGYKKDLGVKELWGEKGYTTK
jgi:hypothetical protein